MCCHRVADTSSNHGVNKEFQRVKYPFLLPNHYTFSINFSAHVANLVGFGPEFPPPPTLSGTLVLDGA